jgi:hypothetical protein
MADNVRRNNLGPPNRLRSVKKRNNREEESIVSSSQPFEQNGVLAILRLILGAGVTPAAEV